MTLGFVICGIRMESKSPADQTSTILQSCALYESALPSLNRICIIDSLRETCFIVQSLGSSISSFAFGNVTDCIPLFGIMSVLPWIFLMTINHTLCRIRIEFRSWITIQ